mmetsp:Transcript_10527/g.25694  ORF Transcript_10527/g.25694 Transcript_10527/m.25694 type:complete len:1042 (-) Transcript_10527:150-3275(-)
MGAGKSGLLEDVCTKSRNQEVLGSWRKSQKMAHMLSAGETSREHEMVLSFTDNSNTKPKASAKIQDLKPILVSQLTPGTVHKGFILKGIILREGVCTGGFYFLMIDALGEVVKVGVYGYPFSQKLARSTFPVGRSIGIREPFFKFGADGRAFVRVDCKEDIAECPSSPPLMDPTWWKDLGNTIAASSCTTAVKCYTKGLQSIAETYATLPSNRAACYLKTKDYRRASVDAGLALRLDPHSKKAHYRLMVALNKIGLYWHVRQLCESALRKWPADRSFIKLVTTPKTNEDTKSRKTCNKDNGEFWFEEGMFVEICTNSALVKSTGAKPTAKVGESKNSWEAMKSQGNKLFREKKFDEAIERYSDAMEFHPHTSIIVKLLSNRALCLSSLDACESLHDASAAVAMPGKNLKPWFRRASALEALHLHDKALQSIQVCVKMCDPAPVEIMRMQERLVSKQSVVPPKESTEEQLKARESAFDPEKQLTHEEMSFVNTMISLSPPDVLVESFGISELPTIPPFHREYPKHCGWPTGVDSKACQLLLDKEFEMSRFLPYTMQMGFATMGVSSRDIQKRLHGVGRIPWYNERRTVGDICPPIYKGTRVRSAHYSSKLRSSFSNSGNKPQIFHTGTVHCAVGFVDLGILLRAKIRYKSNGPLTFVGYDLSPYSVALSLVVWNMLCSPSIDPKAALQVWCSATWSKDTIRQFQIGLHGAIKQAKDDVKHPSSAVMDLLLHWKTAKPVTLGEARRGWHKHHVASKSILAHLLRLKDRLAMGRYEITGDFALGDEPKPAVGSIPMWNCPDGTPPLASNERIFTMIPVTELISKMNSPGKPNCVKSAEDILTQWVGTLAKTARKREIQVHLHHASVQECVSEIQDLRPWTMSWSNVLDYIDPDDFHKIARSCSCHGDTIHFGYSMNWSTETFGANVIDYFDSLKKGGDRAVELFRAGYQATETLYDLLQAGHLFRCPPPENPINTASYGIQLTVHEKWVNHFFAEAKKSGPSVNLGCVEPHVYNPLVATGDSSIDLSWSYDQDIRWEYSRVKGF